MATDGKADVLVTVGAEEKSTIAQLQEDLGVIAPKVEGVKVKIGADTTEAVKGIMVAMDAVKFTSTGKRLGEELAGEVEISTQNIASNIEKQLGVATGTIATNLKANMTYTSDFLKKEFESIGEQIRTQIGGMPEVRIREKFKEQIDISGELISIYNLLGASVKYVNKELGTSVLTTYNFEKQADGTYKVIENLRNSVLGVGKASKENVSEVISIYKQLLGLIGERGRLELEITKLKPTDVAQLELLSQQLNEVNIKYENLFKIGITQNPFAQSVLSVGELNKLSNANLDIQNKIDLVLARQADKLAQQKFTKQLDPSGAWQDQATTMINKLKLVGEESQSAQNAIQNLRQAIENVKGAENIEQQRSAIINLKDETNRAKDVFKNLIPADIGQVALVKSGIDKWLRDTRNASEELKTKMQTLRAELNIPGTTANRLKEIRTELQIARNETSNFTGEVKKMILMMFGLHSTYAIMNKIVRIFKDMTSTVIELNTQMTELVKLTGISGNAYNAFLDDAIVRAKELNVAITDVVVATSDFVRMGLGMEEAKEAANAALVFKNVAYGINDVSNASEMMIATLKGFGIEASRSMDIVDKFVAVNYYLPPYIVIYSEKNGYIGEGLLSFCA